MSPDSSSRIALPWSEHPPVPHATQIGKANADQQIRVTVLLHRKTALDLDSLHGRQLSHKELAEKYGASQAAFDAVRSFAEAHGLKVDENASSLVRRRVELRGPVHAFEAAFGVTLNDYEPSHSRRKGASFHAITGEVTMPAEVVPHVEAVLGLDNRPIATSKMIVRAKAQSTSGTFTPPQVARAYGFPSGNGAGQTIGIIELGGGFTTTDIANYFSGLGLTAPRVTAITLDGGSNTPGDPSGADGEVMLDIEVAGAVAPGANIVVYFTTNTDQGFQDAISTAIHDTTNSPSVISISWGGPESSWVQTAINGMDSTCQSAAALGVTITVAAGDGGSSDGATGDNVDFPASSPHVLACGGTALTVSNGVRQSEVVWNDQAAGGGATGGGVSTVFALPAWQAGAGVPASKAKKKKKSSHEDIPESSDRVKKAASGGRGVPDVAGDASPESGFQILVDGQQEVVGGTSAVAPLWAGLIALLNQQLGRKVGFLNPRLYTLGLASAQTAFYDITSGNNGDFSAGPGWDACTGLGSPNGEALLAGLQASTSTGS